MKDQITVNRRDFILSTGAALTGLVVAFNLPSGMKHAMAAEHAAPAAPLAPPNAFIRIAPDNSITMVINKLEMGQGVNTSMAQLIAEELECDWTSITSVSAPVNAVYNHTIFQMQMTGGSTALASSWDQYRKIGASMREMLKAAAAKTWNVPVKEVRAEKGFIHHPKQGKLSYGELAQTAQGMELPTNPTLKKAKDFKVIGKSMKRVDAVDKTKGTAIFGMDVRLPGMLYAVIARSHIDGGKVKSFNQSAAKKIPGVKDVIHYGNNVAVLAISTHAAKLGRDALEVKWDFGANANASTESMMKEFKDLAQKKGIVAKNMGSAEEAMKKAKTTINADYEFPFLAHAPMEPLNCTVDFDGKKASIWSGHQMPTVDQQVASKIFGINPQEVTVNTVYAGGSFGRRASKMSDYVIIACELAKEIKKPVKVVWTREDDMHAGYYRPMNFHKVTLGFDEKNKFLAWDHHIVGQSVIGGSMFEAMMVKDGLEATITEGISDTHYNLPHFHIEQTRAKTPVTTLWWRSVGHTHTAYVMETMIDEIATTSKLDPLKMRRDLLQKSPRHVAVLDLLKKQTGWGTKKAPKGRAWGLAIHESFGTVVGQVAEVSIVEGMPRVHKVWCSVHCGQVVNPEGAKTQVEGAIVYGLSGALFQEIVIKNGEVVQSNFDDYPVIRMQDMPEVFVEFVKTDVPPTGLGEPGLPPIAPAVANAVYQLTKKRIRVLPFSKSMKA